MKRLSIAVLFIVAGCPMGTPTLDLTAGRLVVDGEVRVTAVAVNADGTPGLGAVSFSASLGTLSAASAQLSDGSAKTTLSCPRMVLGCVPGASIEVTAKWASPKGELTKTLSVKVNAASTSDGGLPIDAGTDAGRADAGLPDSGTIEPFDAGLADDGGILIDGTAIDDPNGFVFGTLGPWRTIGFSSFSSAHAFIGFDRMPDDVVVWSNRLVYLRDGRARIWSEDVLFPVPDAGDPDAGDLDAGDLDAGDPDAGDLDGGSDAGLDAGAAGDAGLDGGLPLFEPERNDLELPLCLGSFGVPDAGVVSSLTATPNGAAWIGCSPSLNELSRVTFRRGLTFFTPSFVAKPIAATAAVLLATANNRLYILSRQDTKTVALPPNRTVSGVAARSRGNRFEVLVAENGGGCRLAIIDASTASYDDALLLPVSEAACLETLFYGERDVLVRFGANTDGGIEGLIGVPFRRTPSGVLAPGFDGGVFFVPGPPTDQLAQPPVLSIDFARPVRLLAP